jgi:hypothetical protein
LKETFDIGTVLAAAWAGTAGVCAKAVGGAALKATDAAVPSNSFRRDNSKSLGPCMSCSRFAVVRQRARLDARIGHPVAHRVTAARFGCSLPGFTIERGG